MQEMNLPDGRVGRCPAPVNAYNAPAWVGNYSASEARTTVYGPYTVAFSADPVVANRFVMTPENGAVMRR